MVGNAIFPYIQTVSFMVSNSSQSMNLYKKQNFCFEIIQYEQTLHTHSSDQTSEKLPDTKGKNKTTMLVCVVNCVLINYMALSFNVAQSMGAKKQA